MKTVIINGSPREKGDTAFLINELKSRLNGEVYELSAYKANISPCIDCRYCWHKKGCKIRDDMDIIYADDYDNIVIASPVYMSSLTPPVMSIGSRLQIYYSAKRKVKDEIKLRRKKGGLILTAGGDGAPAQALMAAKMFFAILKAGYCEDDAVLSLNTDAVSSKDDTKAIQSTHNLANLLNGGLL